MSARGVLLVLAALAAVGCGGDGVIIEPPVPTAPTLSALQDSVFTPHCAISGCHVNPGAEQGMDLSEGKFYANTVNVDVVELPGYKRILPGNSTDSYLYMKLAADPRIVGAQMPFGGMLTAADIEAVREWIDAGALDN